MQYPYKQRSPPSASRQQFSSPIVDMDGFPAASFASTAPSNRKQNDNTNDAFLITRNDAKNVRKLEPASAIMVGDWGADSTVASSSIATSQNHDRIAAALCVATNRQPPKTRDQQIFRRPGVGTSLSRSFDSNNSRGRSNEQNIISEDNKPSPPNNNTVNSGITFQPYDVRHDNTPPRKSMAQSSTSRGNLLPQLATTNQTSKSNHCITNTITIKISDE
jgi:hypothetical protein